MSEKLFHVRCKKCDSDLNIDVINDVISVEPCIKCKAPILHNCDVSEDCPKALASEIFEEDLECLVAESWQGQLLFHIK